MPDATSYQQATDDFAQLCDIVARLRGPDGCPWDREQTRESLVPALLEEAYEVAGAVRANNDTNLREELGDLLLVIVMQAQIASEEGRFNVENVVREISEKLVRRHPHVFGPVKLCGSEAVLKQWEAIKRDEKGNDEHYLGSVPTALPALMRAQKTQKKAARVNFDWSELRHVLAKLDEELAETKKAIESADPRAIADEIGDLLFAVVNLARKRNLDAEIVLQTATDKFIARFNEMEDRLRRRGGKLGDATLDELDAIWNEVKAGRHLEQSKAPAGNARYDA
ncbi:MAG: nucleoside triphosphate pyrophosphohydrolase [Verrucomicrobia bacterium]|nr:nucleoside triphosphate pyrophosphohydrolase [Verrucomicrobiota bacterium]